MSDKKAEQICGIINLENDVVFAKNIPTPHHLCRSLYTLASLLCIICSEGYFCIPHTNVFWLEYGNFVVMMPLAIYTCISL